MAKRMVLALLLFLCLQTVALAAGETVSLPEFASRLNQAAVALERSDVNGATAVLPRSLLVETPQGPVPVDFGWMYDRLPVLRLYATDRNDAARALRDLATDARRIEQSGQAGLKERLEQAARDRAALERILGPRARERAPTLWDRFWEAVGRAWKKLWSWLDIPGRQGGMLGRILGFLVVAGALGALGYLLRGYISWDRFKRLRTAPRPVAARPADAEALRAEALALEQAGRRREAIKVLMKAVLSRLAARKLVDFQPVLTNRIYVYQLRRRRPDLGPALDELNRLYELKVYGLRPVSAEEFQRARELAAALWEEGSLSSVS